MNSKDKRELLEDLPIIIIIAIIPSVFIGFVVDFLHGFFYGLVFLTGYGIGKDMGYKKGKGTN